MTMRNLPAIILAAALLTFTGCKLPKTPPAPNETPQQTEEREENDRAAQEAEDVKNAEAIDHTAKTVSGFLPPPFDVLALAGSNALTFWLARRSRKQEPAK